MAENEKYKGVIVPMVTPLTASLEVDEVSFAKIMKTFTSNELSAFVAGTTGESASLARIQRLRLAEYAVKYRSGSSLVFAGISGNSLSEVIEDGKSCAALGVDALVAHLPFYYPVSDEQVYSFFSSIADQTDCPLFIYNHPALVGRSIPLDVAEKLSQHPNIAGLKDSERNPDRLDASLELWKERKDFAFLLGWAAQSANALEKGAKGIVPSTANLSPSTYKKLYNNAVKGNAEKAEYYQLLTNKISLLYQENRNISQSIPALKALMESRSLCEAHVLPPMERITEKEKVLLATRLKELEKEDTL